MRSQQFYFWYYDRLHVFSHAAFLLYIGMSHTGIVARMSRL
jgi:hypothetical protein